MRYELSGAALYIQRLRRTARVASAVWHRISRSKIGMAILATLATASIVLAAKFVFGIYGLLRLADVGGNVPGGPGALGAGGAGVAAGGTGPQPVPAPVPTPDTPYGQGYKDGYNRKSYEGPEPAPKDYKRGWQQGVRDLHRDNRDDADWLLRFSEQMHKWSEAIGGGEEGSSGPGGGKG